MVDITPLVTLATYSPYVLIVGGLFCAAWLSEKILGAVSHILAVIVKILAAGGWIIGIVSLVTGAAVYLATGGLFDIYTACTFALLIIAGVTLVLQPLKVLPWAALLAAIIGLAACGAVFLIFGGVSVYIFAAIFFVAAILVYMAFKFVEDMLRVVSMILSYPLVAVPIGFACIAEGILMLLGSSICLLV